MTASFLLYLAKEFNIMRIVSRTVYGAAMQTAQHFGKPYIPQENSTLNEKFGIQSNAVPADTERHAVQYFCIGNGGHRAVSGAEGIPYTDPNHHEATDAACFNHLPFVLRETANDLTVEQRNNYGLRREETHGGKQYFAYYAKRLNLDSSNVNLQKTSIVNNTQTTEPFIPTTTNLNPTPIIDSENADNVIEASGEYVSGSAVVTIDFNEADAAELEAVAMILYGDSKYAVVSEIAFVGGIERIVTGPGPGNTTINYRETVASQVTTFIAVYYQMNVQNNGFTFTADVGVTEPLFSIDSSEET